MTEPLHSETTERTPDGFTKKIRRNTHKPLRFAEPLTIIEFSLTPESKEKLKEALNPFIEKYKDARFPDSINLDQAEAKFLKQIAEQIFPSEVIDYFKHLNIDESQNISPYVYIIRNLPEIEETEALLGQTNHRYYAYWIAKAFALSANMIQTKTGTLTRFKGDERIVGQELHKHSADATCFNIIHDGVGNITNTNFVDYVGAQDDHYLNNLSDKHAINPERKWNSNLRSNELIISYHTKEYHELHDLLPTYSSEVTLGNGDMAIWSENGRLFHQATPTKFANNTDRYTGSRIAMFSDLRS